MHTVMERIDALMSRRGRRHPPDAAARLLATTASPWGATMVGLAASIALRANGRRWLPVALAAPSAVGSAKLFKKLTRRRRPGWAGFERKGRESFPSSHVAGHAAVLASLWCLAPRTDAWRAAMVIGCGLTAGIGVGLALGGMARRASRIRNEGK